MVIYCLLAKASVLLDQQLLQQLCALTAVLLNTLRSTGHTSDHASGSAKEQYVVDVVP
jgi:hypothetical protein